MGNNYAENVKLPGGERTMVNSPIYRIDVCDIDRFDIVSELPAPRNDKMDTIFFSFSFSFSVFFFPCLPLSSSHAVAECNTACLQSMLYVPLFTVF